MESTLPAPTFSRISFAAGITALAGILVMTLVVSSPFEVLFQTGLGETATAVIMSIGIGGLITGLIGLARRERGLLLGLGLGLSALALSVKFILAALLLAFVVALVSAFLSGGL